MPITKTLKDNIRYFGINLPIDRRTNVYKDELKKRNLNEKSYIEFLKTLVKQAKAKEQKKIKMIEKQTKVQLEQLELQTKTEKTRRVQKQAYMQKVRQLQTTYIRNQLFRQKPVETAFNSYWKYSIENIRDNLVFGEDELIEAVSKQDVLNLLVLYKVADFLMKYLNHKVWFSIEFLKTDREKEQLNNNDFSDEYYKEMNKKFEMEQAGITYDEW
jgi:hypothetical protein